MRGRRAQQPRFIVPSCRRDQAVSSRAERAVKRSEASAASRAVPAVGTALSPPLVAPRGDAVLPFFYQHYRPIARSLGLFVEFFLFLKQYALLEEHRSVPAAQKLRFPLHPLPRLCSGTLGQRCPHPWHHRHPFATPVVTPRPARRSDKEADAAFGPRALLFFSQRGRFPLPPSAASSLPPFIPPADPTPRGRPCRGAAVL